MATRSRLSIVCEGLLLAILFLGLSFSTTCNASRKMGGADLLGGAALPSGTAASADACAGRESCQTRSALEQDVDAMHQSAESTKSLGFMDSAATAAKTSNSRMADHDDNSEWKRNSEHQNMKMEHESLDSNTLREDQSSMRDSDRMRENSKWMSDATQRHLRELENMRDRMSDSERIHHSADTMSDIDKRFRNPQRLRDSQGTRIDSEGMRETHSMRDSDRMRDTRMMANSDGMMDSDMLTESQKMSTSQNMDTVDHDHRSTSRHLEEMLNSEHRRDSNQMMNQGRLGESAAENFRNSESWRRTDLGNAQDKQSEMMRDSYSARASEGRRELENPGDVNNMMDSAAAQMHNLDGEKGLGSEMTGEQMNDLHRRGNLERMRNANNVQGWEQAKANFHTMRNSNAVRSMMGNMMERQHSSTMEPTFCQGIACRSTSDLHRRDSRAIDLDSMPFTSRHSDAEINSGSQSENSKTAYSSTSAERCSGMNAADCDAAIDGEVHGSQKMQISQRNNDLSLSSCRLGGADCRMATKRAADDIPRSMETTQMSSCSNGDCHTSVAHNEEPMAERQHRTRNAREIISSPKWVKLARTTSTMNGASKRMDNDQESLPVANQGMTKSTAAETMETSRSGGHFGYIDAEKRNSHMEGSEMLQSTSNRLTRSTAEITGTISCNNGADCRSTSGIMHMSKRDAESVGHIHTQEITGRSSCTNGSDCTSTSEIMHMSRSSCTNGVDCRSTSEITHMSPRDSELMGHGDEQIINGPSSCANGADCQSASEIMHMRTRDSEMMGRKDESQMTHTGSNWSSKNGDLTMDQEMVDHSKTMNPESDEMNAAAEMNMRNSINSNEEAADNLPIHRGN